MAINQIHISSFHKITVDAEIPLQGRSRRKGHQSRILYKILHKRTYVQFNHQTTTPAPLSKTQIQKPTHE